MGFFYPPPIPVSLKKAKIAVFFPVKSKRLTQRLVRTSLHAPPSCPGPTERGAASIETHSQTNMLRSTTVTRMRNSSLFLQMFYSALLCTGFVLAYAKAARATVLIANDSGGPLGGYMQRYASIRDSGEHVVVDGQCLSACTLVLAFIPRERICLTRNAIFGFHAATAQSEWRFPGAAGAATRVLWELYPEPVRRLIVEKGGLSDKMIYLSARELAQSFPLCQVRSPD